MESLCEVKLELMDEDDCQATSSNTRTFTITGIYDEPTRLQVTPVTSTPIDQEQTKKERNEFFSTSHLSPAQKRTLKDEILNADKHIAFPTLPMKRIEKYAPPPPSVSKPKASYKKYTNLIHQPHKNAAVKMLDSTCTLTAWKLKEIKYREKNNESCRRSRENRKKEMTQIQIEEEELISRNKLLHYHIDGLETTIQNLRNSILNLVNGQKMMDLRVKSEPESSDEDEY